MACLNITTAICEKLSYSDDLGISNTLKNFRDNVIQQNLRYSKTLFEYDIIDPIIANVINKDKKDKTEMWIAIYNFYLVAITNLIREEKYNEAVERYSEMIADLKEHYGINEYIHELTQNYGMGQEKVKLLRLEEEI